VVGYEMKIPQRRFKAADAIKIHIVSDSIAGAGNFLRGISGLF